MREGTTIKASFCHQYSRSLKCKSWRKQKIFPFPNNSKFIKKLLNTNFPRKLKAYWSWRFAREDKGLSNITGSRLCHPPTAEYAQNGANLLQETFFSTKNLFTQPCMFSKGCFSDHRILMQVRRPLKKLYFNFNFFPDTLRPWNFKTGTDNFTLQNIFHLSLRNIGIICTLYKSL